MNSILSLYSPYIKFLFSLSVYNIQSLEFKVFMVLCAVQDPNAGLQSKQDKQKNKPLLKIKGKSPKYTSPGQKHDCWVGTHRNNKQGKVRHWQGGIEGY